MTGHGLYLPPIKWWWLGDSLWHGFTHSTIINTLLKDISFCYHCSYDYDCAIFWWWNPQYAMVESHYFLINSWVIHFEGLLLLFCFQTCFRMLVVGPVVDRFSFQVHMFSHDFCNFAISRQLQLEWQRLGIRVTRRVLFDMFLMFFRNFRRQQDGTLARWCSDWVMVIADLLANRHDTGFIVFGLQNGSTKPGGLLWPGIVWPTIFFWGKGCPKHHSLAKDCFSTDRLFRKWDPNSCGFSIIPLFRGGKPLGYTVAQSREKKHQIAMEIPMEIMMEITVLGRWLEWMPLPIRMPGSEDESKVCFGWATFFFRRNGAQNGI